jgi:hypothetical protein
MSEKQQAPRAKQPTRSKTTTPRQKAKPTAPFKQKVPTQRSPVTGWQPIDKPRLMVSREAARQAQVEEAQRPLTFWRLMIQLLPVWALVIMILIVAPTLPFRAIGALVSWLRPDPGPPPPQGEPAFVVEGAESSTIESQLPPPNWSLDISPSFTPEVQHWREHIANWSLTYRIKPNMIATLIQIESCGDPTVISSMGASGLFQVMPFNFADNEDPFDPETNARRGLAYFAEMLAAADNDPGLAFAAYNGGRTVIYQSPSDWPSETQDYQFWGSGIYEEAELGLSESPTLQDWLDAGGASLCAQAASNLGLTGGQ